MNSFILHKTNEDSSLFVTNEKGEAVAKFLVKIVQKNHPQYTGNVERISSLYLQITTQTRHTLEFNQIFETLSRFKKELDHLMEGQPTRVWDNLAFDYIDINDLFPILRIKGFLKTQVEDENEEE